MEMNTNTIPEAKEAAIKFCSDDACPWHQQQLTALIEKACISYHSRRLAECGDAQETTEKIYGKYKVGITTGQFACAMANARELLQLHTAKAMEEATKADDDFIKKVTIKAYEIPNPCSNPGDAVLYALNEAATLQKQCEELRELHNMQLATLQQDVRPLVEALNQIASYSEGTQVTNSFDEPYSARTAREPLETFLSKHPELGPNP